MKSSDEDLWERQVQDLLEDPTGTGKEFLKFFEFWVDSAEDVLLNYPDRTPLAALHLSLPMAETRFGEITAPTLAAMLVLVIAHWKRGTEIVAELSCFEMKLVTEVLHGKLAVWQASAEINPA